MATTIPNGSKYMQAVTYTGTGATQTITVGFQPDFVWVKSRSAATDHKLTDSVRGATKALISDTTGAETTDTNGVTAFTSTGFTLGSDSVYNTNGATYVAWCWQAGQGSSGSNTNGSITSTVSVNATAGFSVVTYTGTGANATVGHGLGVAPKMIIVKNRSSALDWLVGHTGLTSWTYNIYLDLTSAQSSNPTAWNSTAPTSSVFSVGTWNAANGSGNSMVAYCWAEIAGFSKFTSYTGNGSADGVFVYLGFRPKFVMIKNTSTAGTSWVILDTSRNSYNIEDAILYPNVSNSEATFSSLDGLSNGFKIRNTDGAMNTNGNTYIVAAFAENPFKNSLAR